VDILCGYATANLRGPLDIHALEHISAEHSSVHSC
jgi:hypothetical protein